MRATQDRAQHSTLLALPQQSFEMRQFGVRVDAQDLLGISHSDMRHTVLLSYCESHDIREILFPLGVVASDTPQGRKEKRGLQTVHPAINLAHRLFSLRGIPLFHNTRDPSSRVA